MKIEICRLWVINDLTVLKFDFRFTPESGLNVDTPTCPKSANRRLMHRSNDHCYLVTSSA